MARTAKTAGRQDKGKAPKAPAAPAHRSGQQQHQPSRASRPGRPMGGQHEHSDALMEFLYKLYNNDAVSLKTIKQYKSLLNTLARGAGHDELVTPPFDLSWIREDPDGVIDVIKRSYTKINSLSTYIGYIVKIAKLLKAPDAAIAKYTAAKTGHTTVRDQQNNENALSTDEAENWRPWGLYVLRTYDLMLECTSYVQSDEPLNKKGKVLINQALAALLNVIEPPMHSEISNMKIMHEQPPVGVGKPNFVWIKDESRSAAQPASGGVNSVWFYVNTSKSRKGARAINGPGMGPDSWQLSELVTDMILGSLAKWPREYLLGTTIEGKDDALVPERVQTEELYYNLLRDAFRDMDPTRRNKVGIDLLRAQFASNWYKVHNNDASENQIRELARRMRHNPATSRRDYRKLDRYTDAVERTCLERLGRLDPETLDSMGTAERLLGVDVAPVEADAVEGEDDEEPLDEYEGGFEDHEPPSDQPETSAQAERRAAQAAQVPHPRPYNVPLQVTTVDRKLPQRYSVNGNDDRPSAGATPLWYNRWWSREVRPNYSREYYANLPEEKKKQYAANSAAKKTITRQLEKQARQREQEAAAAAAAAARAAAAAAAAAAAEEAADAAE